MLRRTMSLVPSLRAGHSLKKKKTTSMRKRTMKHIRKVCSRIV